MGWKPQGSPSVLFFPSSPEEVRNEVDILMSDLIVRLKQLLFNSILCAYYVGFIPIQFANVSRLVCGSTSSIAVPGSTGWKVYPVQSLLK